MVEQKTTVPTEAEKILQLEESHYLDMKAAEIKPAKLSETISAFANTSGGEIFVGVGEKRQEDGSRLRYWSGFPNMEAANAHIQILDGMGALGNHYRASFIHVPGREHSHPGYVLHLTIAKTRDILRATDNFPYIRRNASNLRVATEDGVRRLQLDKGIATFEDEVVAVKASTITNSKVMLSFALAVVPSAEPEEWAESQFITLDDRPTVAGVLLYADQPQAALPKRSAIKIFRYKTREEEGTRETLAFDPVTVEGPIYNLISDAVSGTKKIVEGIQRLGVNGLENITYPHETLHEIVTNAVLHRDYSIASDIQIRIYDNRIEVESPGRLPGHVTTENVLREQSARNPKIVRLINKFPDPPNKDVGEGLNTAFEAMKALRLKEPEIEENEHSVVVYVSHSSLASPEETVIEFLKTHSEITNRIGRDLTGIRSENSMKDVFLRLKKRALIEPVPDKRGNLASWRKCVKDMPERHDRIDTKKLDQPNFEGQISSKSLQTPSIEPDKVWPGMWRVQLPDGTFSDLTNRTRAKDLLISLGRSTNK
ncbi:ATP-dependent DNA helicase RecG [Tardiphaga sp. OK246]|nr:ATP-dependent DNA helicase RecG [Tardiphaga sp. OK246]